MNPLGENQRHHLLGCRMQRLSPQRGQETLWATGRVSVPGLGFPHRVTHGKPGRVLVQPRGGRLVGGDPTRMAGIAGLLRPHSYSLSFLATFWKGLFQSEKGGGTVPEKLQSKKGSQETAKKTARK